MSTPIASQFFTGISQITDSESKDILAIRIVGFSNELTLVMQESNLYTVGFIVTQYDKEGNKFTRFYRFSDMTTIEVPNTTAINLNISSDYTALERRGTARENIIAGYANLDDAIYQL